MMVILLNKSEILKLRIKYEVTIKSYCPPSGPCKYDVD